MTKGVLYDAQIRRKTLTRRLVGEYPIGPIDEDGEPEFGWRNFGAQIPPINHEAAAEIQRLRDENARLSQALAERGLKA